MTRTDQHFYRRIEADIAFDRGRLELLLDTHLAPIARGLASDLLIDLICATIAATLAATGIDADDGAGAGGRFVTVDSQPVSRIDVGLYLPKSKPVAVGRNGLLGTSSLSPQEYST